MKGHDRHPLRAAVGLGVLVAIGGMVWSLLVWPTLQPIPPYGYWAAPPDVWHVLLASADVTHGRLLFIYEAGAIWRGGVFTNQFATGQYQAGPLLPILLTPIALLGERFHLSAWMLQWNPRPSMWLVYGPYGMLISSIPFLYAVRSFAVAAGINRHLLRLQVIAGVLVLIPVVGYYGHYDDVLALTFLILSARDLSKQRWTRSAVMLGVAVGFKQWAWMALPLLLATTPMRHWLRSLLPSAVAPAAFFALTLVADWPFASLALLKADACPACGHAALWAPEQAMDYVAGPVRTGVFLVAFVVAWRMWGKRDATSLSAALGVTLLARVFFEPVAYAYHVAVALPLLLFDEELERGRPWRTLVLGSGMLLWFPYHPPMRVLWWSPFAAAAVAVAWQACWRIFSPGGHSHGHVERRSARPGRSARAASATRRAGTRHRRAAR